jgi:predicted ATPase/DNA-binding SARP family transcriptional activator
MNNLWRVNLLGGLRIQRGEQVITRFKTQKVASLFAYLAFHLRQEHSREILMEMLWPESDTPTLRNSLSVALSSLRNQMEPPGVSQGTVIRADRFSVGLNPATVTTDVAEFELAITAAAKAGSSLERVQFLTEAVELYQGPLLPGFYEEWIALEQDRLTGLFFDSVAPLVNHLEEVGDTRSALTYARRAILIDPLREESQEILIRLLYADNQSGAALRQYRDYQRLLKEEMGEEPTSTLRSLVGQIESRSGVAAPDSVESLKRRGRKSTRSPIANYGPATVTFLMTDIGSSARLVQSALEEYSAARERHHLLIRQAVLEHGGQEVQETGDGFVVAFFTAGSALSCAVAAQQALALEVWPEAVGPLRVRMSLHTGDVIPSGEEGQYRGIAMQHATRMLTAARGGQILASDSTASLASGLKEVGIRFVDLGVWRLRDVPEARRLFQVEYPGMGQTEFGPLAAESGHKPNMPPRFTRFFGRVEEIKRLRDMLLSDSIRLVTITGPAGNGKSRLSLEVAERLSESLAGAVYFVPLADLRDPTLVVGAILDSLGVARSPQKEPLEQVVSALSEKPTLLVLDNFEHLLEGGTDVVRALLSSVPTLKVLTTSRQLLGISAERGFTLSPLPVPGTEETPEELSLYDSVQLFIDRAQHVMPHFQVNNANATAVAALVGGLEGIPLAIELAAARVQVLTPTQMLSQLSHRLEFLASRKRSVSERQRTLRGALEWSYRLLSPELQRFFSRLSIFRGGWTVEAAEAVCEEPIALDYLEQLRECSLILVSDSNSYALRFRMLEMLREFGQERLVDRSELNAIRYRHQSYFLALAEEADKNLKDAEQQSCLERLDTEHDNMRAALEWSLESENGAEPGLRLGGAMWRFWYMRGHFGEGRRRLSQALHLPCAPATDTHGESHRSARAKALNAEGVLANVQGDYSAARALSEESLAITRELGDRHGIASSLNILGIVARHEGAYPLARALYEESLAITRELGDRQGIASSLNNLGLVAEIQGDYAAARSLHEESLAIKRELGARHAIAMSLDNLGAVAYRQGDFPAARGLHEESLAIRRELGDRLGIATSLEEIGRLALAVELPERAARLWGAAESLREVIGSPMPHSDRAEYDRDRATAREVVGEATFDFAFTEGRAMTWEAAVTYALA